MYTHHKPSPGGNGSQDQRAQERARSVETLDVGSAGSRLEAGPEPRGDLLEQPPATAFRLLFDQSDVGLALLDLQGRVVHANRALQRLLGVPRMMLRERRLLSLLHPGDRQRAADQLTDLVAGRTGRFTWQVRDGRQDGAIRWYEGPLTLIRDHQEQPLLIAVTLRDVTVEHRLAEALRQSEVRQRFLLEGVADVIVELDERGCLRYVGPQVETVLGLVPARLMERPADRFVHPQDLPPLLEAGRRLFGEAGTTGTLEARLRAADGTWHRLRGRARSTVRPDGSFAVVVVAHEHTREPRARPARGTPRARLDHHVQGHPQARAVQSLAGGVAHHFNNLLAVVLGYSELLVRRHDAPPDSLADLETIRNAVVSGRHLSDLLARFAGRRPPRRRIVDAATLAADQATAIRERMGDDLEVVQNDRAAATIVYADPTLLAEALSLLSDNAMDAMPRGGTLTLETRVRQLDAAEALRCGGVSPGAYVAISVADTGCGMAPEVAARIFEPFFTTKEVGQGIGLSLSVVESIVTRHQGHVAVCSRPGQGTTFELLIPQHDGLDHLE